MPAIVLLVDFLADGRCDVHRGRGALSAGLRVSSEISHEHLPDQSGGAPIGGGFRCPIPYAALGSNAVELRVVLPPGVAPSGDVFPRLDWRQESAHWIGSASLPSAPAFVSLQPASSVAPPYGGFGWNFYGFFVFAAAFIAVYFGWARWMMRRDRERTAAR